MMNPMCQADFYGSNFHAAHAAHAAAVATGHTWAYGYPQQYPFGAHPYPGSMVADMTGLAGLNFCFQRLSYIIINIFAPKVQFLTKHRQLRYSQPNLSLHKVVRK